ncbi:hypothetical protein FHX42_002579 [Saccharopolyspora lacisalsi]|uniref:PH domain-containing protein n=1 Tax=Halosaccharopolyspora lacisalsi TaxID=1000566 RepID=A0A839E2S5_9PSEU|nr:hypothetical protein [Halosaccharopolyspora lacisalsi]MBA8825228.1 hypothetical protein [Halosaccharopolyspora lacisalsi]
MKWLPGGWQRADQAERERATTPHRDGSTRRVDIQRGATRHPAEETRVNPTATRDSAPPGGPSILGRDARDIDISATAFRNLIIGGGISGFLTVVCAAALSGSGSGFWLWLWQLLFGVIFLWFLISSRGVLSSRGFLVDRGGLYARTRGEVFGITWREIGAVGVGSLPWIQNKRPTHPERRQALEIYPADADFPERHPELERWRVEETAPMPGLPGVRYRFHLPPLSRLPHRMEQAVQSVAPRKWVGQYRRH